MYSYSGDSPYVVLSRLTGNIKQLKSSDIRSYFWDDRYFIKAFKVRLKAYTNMKAKEMSSYEQSCSPKSN